MKLLPLLVTAAAGFAAVAFLAGYAGVGAGFIALGVAAVGLADYTAERVRVSVQ